MFDSLHVCFSTGQIEDANGNSLPFSWPATTHVALTVLAKPQFQPTLGVSDASVSRWTTTAL